MLMRVAFYQIHRAFSPSFTVLLEHEPSVFSKIVESHRQRCFSCDYGFISKLRVLISTSAHRNTLVVTELQYKSIRLYKLTSRGCEAVGQSTSIP